MQKGFPCLGKFGRARSAPPGRLARVPTGKIVFSLGIWLALPLKLVRSDAEISGTLPKRRGARMPKGRLTEERTRTEAGGGRHERQRDEAA